MFRLFSGFLAGLWVSIVFAQQDAVVVTASRFPQPRSQTLQPVTVITAEDIAQAGQQTLVEVLQALGGVEIAANGGFGQTTSVFMRGANASHTLVLVDGMRLASATDARTALENIPLAQIERIEVVPGQLSSLYGSEAIGGVIQIFTKAGSAAPSASVSGGAGSYDSRSLNAGLRRSFGATDVGIDAGYFESQGFDATKPGAFGHNPDRDPYRNRNVSARIAQHVGDRHELGMTLFQSEGTTHFDGDAATDDLNQQRLSAYSVYSRNAITRRWKSLLRLGEATDDSRFRGSLDGVFFTTRQPQVLWQNDVAIGPGTAIAGAEYVTQHLASGTAFTQTYRSVKSVFAGYAGRAGRHAWQVNVRRDDNSQFGSHDTGLLGYAFDVTTALQARASLSTGFKAPTFNDLYFPGSANPDLRPELARNREVGLNYRRGAHSLSATYFENRITDLIVFVTTDPVTFAGAPQNVDRARIKGMELAYEGFAGSWRWRAQATLQDPVDESTAKLLPRRSRRHANLAANRALGPWKLGAEVIASSERFDKAQEDPASRMHGYALLNLTASYAFNRALYLRARWNNVFDRDYELVQNFNIPGSNLFVALQYQTP